MNPENPPAQVLGQAVPATDPNVASAPTAGIPQVPPMPNTPPPQEPKKRKLPKLLLTIVLILAVLFIAAYAGMYIFMQEQLNSLLGAAKPTPTLAPTPIPISPSPTPDPTASWNTFTDPELGFSMKYPPDFGHEKCNSGSGERLLCSDVVEDDPVHPYYYFIGFNQIEPRDSVTGIGKINYRTELINNIEVLRTFELPSHLGAEYVYFKKDDGSHIEVFFTGYDEADPFPEQEKYKQLFDQMLETFKLLDSTSSASPSQLQVTCTADAKLCPDGSTVGRVGPNCEFAACPN